MRLDTIFRSEDVLVGFEAEDKWDAIERILNHFVDSEAIPADKRDVLLDAVLHRERSMSTGMERGLAIPHAAVDDLEQVVAGLAIVRDEEGLNFEGTDASPTRLVVLLLIPRSQKLQHIRTLAEIARVMSHDDVRAGLLEAGSAQEAWNVLTEGDSSSS